MLTRNEKLIFDVDSLLKGFITSKKSTPVKLYSTITILSCFGIVIIMDVKELLKFVDESLFAKTGKRLNDLQRQVIEGVLNHQKYVDIAESFERSEGHVKDAGYKLLQMLSEIFEEPVTKGSLKSVLERQRSNVTVNVGDGNVGNIGHISHCVNFNSDSKLKANQVPLEKPNSQKEKQIAKIKKLRDLGLTDSEIIELLEIPLELIKSIDSDEFPN